MTEQELIEEYYSKPLLLSYSALKKLMYSPKLYYSHYILQQKEERLDSFLVDGSIIHCLLLDDSSFNDQFILIPSNLPGDSSRKCADYVFKFVQETKLLKPEIEILDLSGYPGTILDYLLGINLHQSLKTDQQRLEKILTDDTRSYFEFLKLSQGKILVDSETMQRCNESVAAIRNNSKLCNLLGLLTTEMEDVKIFNEIELNCGKSTVFGLKGKIDNIKVDFDQKTIYINDLKTTSKSLSDFKETVEFYSYWVQAVIYEKLVINNLKLLVGEVHPPNWKIIFNFVVIDKFLQVYAFEVTEDTLKLWRSRFELLCGTFSWHYKNRNFGLPYEYEVGEVKL